MTGSVECRYHGRDFTADEMALLRALIAGPPALNRHALSKEFCRRIRQRLPGDWTARYGTNPVLIETFVETPRYTGAVYRASGWIRVGPTQGRGRYDTKNRYDKPTKDIWLRPLRKDWKRILNR